MSIQLEINFASENPAVDISKMSIKDIYEVLKLIKLTNNKIIADYTANESYCKYDPETGEQLLDETGAYIYETDDDMIQALNEIDYKDFIMNLEHEGLIPLQVNKSWNTIPFTAIGTNLGWRKRTGTNTFSVEVDKPEELLRNLLPDTSDVTIVVYKVEYAKDKPALIITCSHHDSFETYYCIPEQEDDSEDLLDY